MQETTLKTAKKDYLPILNALRGIAAIWVVLFHMDVILFYREVGTLLPKEWSGLLTQGYLWVDFFFILSGFIITHVYREHFNLPFTYKPIKTYYDRKVAEGKPKKVALVAAMAKMLTIMKSVVVRDTPFID